jgi:hypothetical protein
LPGAASQLDGRLEQGEFVHPGREAAFAAELVEAPEHADERIVCRLERDVVEFVAAQVRQCRPASSDLVVRCA